MGERWYDEAVVYRVDVETYADSNEDGCGDIPGLIGRLDYLARLGVTCLWLNPIHPSPRRDGGYDVTDFYGVDPRLGSLGDFAELLHQAGNRLMAEQRAEVFAEFGPDEHMRLYDRGIRRRLAPMLGGDRRRLEMAYSLQFTLRGTPVLRYGEEIGMGEDLSLPGRDAIRTPMQWSPSTNGGFSAAPKLVCPVISGGEYGYEKVNVVAQRHDPHSLLAWFERMIRTLRESPEAGAGRCRHVDRKLPQGVLAHRADGTSGSMLFLHNLGTDDVVVDLSELYPGVARPEPGLRRPAVPAGGAARRAGPCRVRLPLDPPQPQPARLTGLVSLPTRSLPGLWGISRAQRYRYSSQRAAVSPAWKVRNR
jgi:glycosidase